MLAAAGALAINALGVSRTATAVAGMIYGLSWIGFAVVTIRQRRARDVLQGDVLWGLFNQLNKEVFGGDHRTRFTLFQRAPLHPKEFIPLYRYKKGGQSAIAEAEESLMHFDQKAGMVGRAWSEPGELFFRPIPPFGDRAECIDWHVKELGVPRAVANHFGPYVEDIEGIFSYGFMDLQNHILGVLSLDLCAPVSRHVIENDEEGMEAGVLLSFRRPDSIC